MEINQEASQWTCSARHKITGPRRGRLSGSPLPGECCHLPTATPARGCLSSVLPPITVTPELLAVTTQSAVKASTLPGRKGGEGFYSDNRIFNVHSETLLPLKFKLINTEDFLWARSRPGHLKRGSTFQNLTVKGCKSNNSNQTNVNM